MEAFEFTLLLFVLVYTLIFFCHLLLKSRKSELQQKNYFIGVAVFSLSFFLTRFFLLLNDLIYPETLDLSLRQGILYILASFIAAIGVFWLTYIVERFVYPKLHYIPSITLLISAILILVLPRINNINLVTIYTAVSGGVAVLIPILYSIVGFKLSGKTRKKSFLLAFGILLLLLGNILNMGVLRKDFPIFGYLSPMTILIGLIIFHYSLF